MFNKVIVSLLVGAVSLGASTSFALPSFLADNTSQPKFVTVGSGSTPTTTTVSEPSSPADANAGAANAVAASAGAASAGAANAATTSPRTDPVTGQLLNQSINRLSQNQQMVQQLDMQQMHSLQQQNHSLQDEINKLTQAMSLMHQQVGTLDAQVVALSKAAIAKPQPITNVTSDKQIWISFLHSIYFKITTGIIALLLLALIWKLSARTKQSVSDSKPETEAAIETIESDADYDFLSSNDAIPAKLDLARAYIAMEDFSAARAVLNDVLVQGDAEQKRDAQAMLQQIKQKTTTSV